MTRLVFHEGTSHKFWQAERDGRVLHVSWGRVGAAGQAQDKRFANDDAAQAALDKLVREKRAKGYVDEKAAKKSAAARPVKAAKPPAAKPAKPAAPAKKPAAKKTPAAAKKKAPFGRFPVEDLYLVTRKVAPVPAKELADLERDLGPLPDGYAALMARAGFGSFVNELVVHPPAAVRNILKLKAKSDHWSYGPRFWTNFTKLLGEAPDLVTIATSKNGDDLVFRRGEPDRLLVAPRGDDELFEAGGDLPAAFGWFARSEKVGRVIDFGYYNTEREQTRTVYEATHPDGESLDDLLAAVQALPHDADDGNDPPMELFFRAIDGMIWVDHINVRCGLIVWADKGAGAKVKALLRPLVDAGWTLAPRKRR